MIKRSALLLSAIFIISAACSTMGGIQDHKGTGITKPFDYSYAKVYDAALKVGKIQSLTYKEGGKKERYLVFNGSEQWWIKNELIAMYFTEESKNKTVMEVVNQRISKRDIDNKEWMDGFFVAMALELEKN